MEFLNLLVSTFPRFLPALGVTVKITLLGLLFAMPLGLISCLMKISGVKILNWISTGSCCWATIISVTF